MASSSSALELFEERLVDFVGCRRFESELKRLEHLYELFSVDELNRSRAVARGFQRASAVKVPVVMRIRLSARPSAALPNSRTCDAETEPL